MKENEMAYQDEMTNALAVCAVKYMGQIIPEMEFIMSPITRSDLALESGLKSPWMILHDDDSWSFRGVPIREDKSFSNWTLRKKP